MVATPTTFGMAPPSNKPVNSRVANIMVKLVDSAVAIENKPNPATEKTRIRFAPNESASRPPARAPKTKPIKVELAR
jgi:hypothetical protein